MKKHFRTRSMAFLLSSASGLVLLAGCDFTNFKNPFVPDRPPQMVEGERRQPVYNQQMIARVREKTGGVVSSQDNSGIPAPPPEFADAPPMPAPADGAIPVSPPPATATAEEKGFFSSLFSSDEPPPAPPAQPAGGPPPAEGQPAWAQSWVGQAPDANAALAAEQQAPYPSLSSVPPRPDEFETARPRAARVMQDMQASHDNAMQTRSALQEEPSQLTPAQPVEMPAPALRAEPQPAPPPVMRAAPPEPIAAPTPSRAISEPAAAPAPADPQVSTPVIPYTSGDEPAGMAFSPRRGVDIMTQEEWREFQRRSGTSAPAAPAATETPSLPLPTPQEEYPGVKPAEKPADSGGLRVPEGGMNNLPSPWEERSDIAAPATGVAASGESQQAEDERPTVFQRMLGQDKPQQDAAAEPAHEDGGAMDWLKALVKKKEEAEAPAPEAAAPAQPAAPQGQREVLGQITAPPLLKQQEKAAQQLPAPQAAAPVAAAPAQRVKQQDVVQSEVIDATPREPNIFERLFGAREDTKEEAPASVSPPQDADWRTAVRRYDDAPPQPAQAQAQPETPALTLAKPEPLPEPEQEVAANEAPQAPAAEPVQAQPQPQPVPAAAAAPKANRAIAERLARLEREKNGGRQPQKQAAKTAPAPETPLAAPQPEELAQPKPQAAEAEPAASPAPTADSLSLRLQEAEHDEAGDEAAAAPVAETAPAAIPPAAPAAPPSSLPRLAAEAAPVPPVTTGSAPLPANTAADAADAAPAASARGGLPSPKILQEMKMLPPSRYTVRTRTGASN